VGGRGVLLGLECGPFIVTYVALAGVNISLNLGGNLRFRKIKNERGHESASISLTIESNCELYLCRPGKDAGYTFSSAPANIQRYQ
jgi:hypothetical protein